MAHLPRLPLFRPVYRHLMCPSMRKFHTWYERTVGDNIALSVLARSSTFNFVQIAILKPACTIYVVNRASRMTAPTRPAGQHVSRRETHTCNLFRNLTCQCIRWRNGLPNCTSSTVSLILLGEIPERQVSNYYHPLPLHNDDLIYRYPTPVSVVLCLLSWANHQVLVLFWHVSSAGLE